MEKITLVVDKPLSTPWAYHSKAQKLIENCPYSNWEFNIISYRDKDDVLKKAFENSDLNLFFGWQNFKRCQKFASKENSIVNVASHQSFDRGKTTPVNQVKPTKDVVDYLKEFKSVGAVSKRLCDLFESAGLDEIYYTPNGVDTNKFQPDYSIVYEIPVLNCAFAGRDVDEKKGHLTYIKPAIEKAENANVHFAVSNFRRNTVSPFSDNSCHLEHEQMPEFFRKTHIYICMSREEGSCRPVLESMASGCATISSNCGAIRELDPNCIIERNVEVIKDRINNYNDHPDLLLKAMKKNRSIAEKFDWSIVSDYWYQWIERNLP